MPAASSKRTLLWIVAIGFFMETLDSTIVNTALPALAKSLGEDPLSMHSVILAYSLTLAVFIPASGWFADRFGIRKTFLAAVSIFSIGSILCALSPSLPALVASRVLQGIGGSMLMPIGRLAILRTFPHGEFLSAMAFVAVPALIGPLLGPPLGGFIVEFATWHWIFLINIPVGILGIFAILKYMPDIPKQQVQAFDFRGFVMLGLMMVSLSLALEGVSDFGFQHATVTMLVIFGFGALAAYGFHASRDKRALFPFTIFENRAFSIGLIGNLFARVGSAAIPFLVPLLLQVSLGYSPLEAGSTMIPVATAAIVSRRFAPGLILKAGYRRFLIVNTLILGVLIAGLALMTPHFPAWFRLIQLVLFGVVNAFQFSAMNSLTLSDLETKHTASGNSLLSMIQMLAMSFGVANAGAILTAFNRYFDAVGKTSVHAFQGTFISLGLITCMSTWVFAQLGKAKKTTPHVSHVGPNGV